MKGIRNLFGGGGGGGGAGLAEALKAIQEQQNIRNLQGRQMAALSAEQAQADNEAAMFKRPGLGRALLSYRGGQSTTLGGN